MSDAETFRARATLVLWVVYGVLAVGTLVLGFLGGRLGGWIGASVGAGVGVVVSAAVWFVSTLFWAMTQDGA